MKTVLETIRSGTPYLEKAGVENARLNMEHLLTKVLGCRRMQLYLDFDRLLSEDQLAPLRDMVKRRAKREPLQHIMGSVEFAGREFKCDARALIPRPETDQLVESIAAHYKLLGVAPPTAILDMGTGSGIIGLSLAKAWPEARVTLVDVSVDALALARENAAILGITDEKVAFVQSDLFTSVPSQTFDLLAANLPYISAAEIPGLAAEVQCDPIGALAGGTRGTELIVRFLHALSPFAKSGAFIALEVGAGQTTELAEIMRTLALQDVTALNDYSHRDRFLFGSAP